MGDLTLLELVYPQVRASLSKVSIGTSIPADAGLPYWDSLHMQSSDK